MDATRRRREYIELSKELLVFVRQRDRKNSLKTHQSLLEMEDELNPREMVAFRIALYDELEEPDKKAAMTARRDRQKESDVLSVDHRSWMMDEMLQALDREKTNMEDRIESSFRSVTTQTDEEEIADSVVWSASLVCRQFAIQLNDAAVKRVKKQRTSPIILLSTAWMQDHKWYEDGSWDTDCTLASLQVQDLTTSRTQQLQSLYPHLLGRKRESTEPREDGIVIGDTTYSRSVSLAVRRKLVWNTKDGVTQYDDEDRGSRTTFQVRILPMEIVYSTVPVEGLSRVLATIKTPELLEDIHRVASAAQGWRAKQKRKLLQTLAHDHK